MPFDPQIATLLEAAARARRKPLQELSPQEARLRTASDMAAVVGSPDDDVVADNIAIPGPAGVIRATRYRPEAQSPCGPALVFFHGGGWVVGSRATHDPICRALAKSASVQIISIDYRLAPEHPFPAAVDDCWAATKYLLEHASELGLEPTGVGVGGDSAGGNLAAVVARRARDHGLALRCQFLWYPVTSHKLDTSSYRQFTDGYGLSLAEMEWFWAHYVPDAKERGDPDASPFDAVDLSGIAPAVVVTAEYDVLRDEGEQYAARLADSGVPTTRWRAPGMPHSFLSYLAASDAIDDAYGVCALLLAQSLTVPVRR